MRGHLKRPSSRLVHGARWPRDRARTGRPSRSSGAHPEDGRRRPGTPARAPRARPAPAAGFPRPFEAPDHKRHTRQGVDHAGVDQMAPDVAAGAEHERAGECPRRPDMPAQPEIGAHGRQPDRKHRVEVERLPGLQPGVEQVLERMQISRLAFTEKRQTAIEPRAPPREPPGAELVGEEGAIGVIDLGDVEVKERPRRLSASQKNTANAADRTKSAARSLGPRRGGRTIRLVRRWFRSLRWTRSAPRWLSYGTTTRRRSSSADRGRPGARRCEMGQTNRSGRLPASRADDAPPASPHWNRAPPAGPTACPDPAPARATNPGTGWERSATGRRSPAARQERHPVDVPVPSEDVSDVGRYHEIDNQHRPARADRARPASAPTTVQPAAEPARRADRRTDARHDTRERRRRSSPPRESRPENTRPPAQATLAAPARPS